MNRNKLIASILATIMTISVAITPIVSAETTNKEVTAADLIAAGTGYVEDFEDGTAAQDVVGQANGWSYGGQGDGADYLNIWVGDNGSGSNAMRLASTTWYKTMWLNLDLKTNGVAKYVAAGYDEATANEKVDKYLGEDMKLSFRFKLTTGGYDANANHEQYIRVKGDRYNLITELHVKGTELYLCAMNEDKTADTMYSLGTVDVSSDNNIWHDVVVEIDQETNTYKLTLDGTAITSTPWGENIPVGMAADTDKTVGKVSSIELAHVWSGWWQGLSIDDIRIESMAQETVPETDILAAELYEADEDEIGYVATFSTDTTVTNLTWYLKLADGDYTALDIEEKLPTIAEGTVKIGLVVTGFDGIATSDTLSAGYVVE